MENNLKGGKYEVSKLKDVCYSVSGVVYSQKDEIMEDNGLKILRANNINLQNNELDLSNIRFIRNDFVISDIQLLRKNDIFMCSASGSKEHCGKVAFINEDLDYYFGGFMNVLRIRSVNIYPKYLFEILVSSIFRKFLIKILGGTNINNLNFSMIKSFQIPLPPLHIQEEISSHITHIRTQAKQLEAEAKEEIEKAKQEVERMILGQI